MECTALVRGCVDHLLLRDQLGELVALGVAAYAAGLVGEVDLEAVPGQLPHHRDRDDGGAVGPRAHAHRGRAQRAGDAADGPRVVGRVEDIQRALHLQLGVGRHRADVALLAARLGRRGLALPLAFTPRRGRRRRLLVLAALLDALDPLAAAGAQALDERAALVAWVAQLEIVRTRLPDPALVLSACGAQVADAAALAAGEVVLGVLAAQQRAAADVAGDVELVGANVPGTSHGEGARLATPRPRPRRVSPARAGAAQGGGPPPRGGSSTRPPRPLRAPCRRPSAPGARGSPRSAGTRACTRPGRPSPRADRARR